MVRQIQVKLSIILLLTVNVLLVTLLAATPLKASAKEHVIQLTINAAQIHSALTDFPVYIHLADMPINFWENVHTNGGDIRVYTNTNIEVPYELSAFDKGSEEGSLFFKAPTLDSVVDTTFIVTYGDWNNTAYAPTTTYGGHNVWKDEYKAVLHLDNDPSGIITDSTSYQNNAFTMGNMDVSNAIPAILAGTGIDLDGIDDRITIPHSESLDWEYDDAFSIYTWVKTNPENPTGLNAVATKVGSNKGWLCTAWNNEGTADSQYLHLRNNANNEIRVHATTGQELDDDKWHLVHCTYDGSSLASGVGLYGDGDFVTSTVFEDTLNNQTISNNANVVFGTYENYMNGSFDEFRLIKEELSSDWIFAEHANMNTPLSFYTISINPLTPTEQVNNLITYIISLNLPRNVENSYLANLKKVTTFIDRDTLIPAARQLRAFIHKVERGLRQDILSQQEYEYLVSTVNNLVQNISDMEASSSFKTHTGRNDR